MQILCDRWSTQEDCNIKFRPSELHEDGTKTNLLFCYQTAWQRRLLLLYGQQMCLLDATYRTCRYDLPLFFLCVRTNVCYTVVGVFVPHSEKTEDIREALQVFKEWNPEWHPSHFMVDFCEAEIGALEAEFEDSEVLLCDFHREKAWVEWVRKKDHGVSDVQETVLELLRDVASAATPEEYKQSLSRLHDSSRWVQAFRDENLKVAIYTNNGVERQNETLKYSHLDGSKKRSLSDMLTTVVTDFLPTAHRKYIQLNVTYSSCYRKYHESLPPFLKDRPRGVVIHIMSRLSEAQFYDQGDILTIGPGVFHVKSASSQSRQYHKVNFEASTNNMPSCTCKDWSKHKLPCKHFCAIFKLEEGWSWENLSVAYRNNPLFSLDSTFLPTSTTSTDETPQEDSSPLITAAEPPSPPTSSPTPSQPIYCDLPVKRPSRVRKLQRECASLLHEMTNMTYNLQDEVYLASVKEELSSMMEEMMAHAPHDKALPLRSPKKRKREIPKNLHSLPTLPPKHPSVKRVGRQAEVLKSTFHVNVSVESREKAPKLETTVVDCELETVLDSILELEAVEDCNLEADAEWLTINHTKLTQRDRQTLQEDKWLTDKHMNSAQHLIRSEYPFIDALRDTVILVDNTHDPILGSRDCLQIHHLRDHWVLSAAIDGKITVYDSLHPSMTPELRSQLVHLYKQFAQGEDRIIPIKVTCAQRQQGGNDCGLYAVANAVALAEEIPPTQVVFDQSQMRKHLEDCFEMKEIKMFPYQTVKQSTVSKHYQLSTYCNCYEHRPGSPMIMCDKCVQWFHYPCVNLSESEVHTMVTQKLDYVCPECSRT
ncbi:uncharacterized protein [Branchiostoma lanceolatum]|uniref:uncharacterized protein n=1 Tax=Branchiostoma lanceolatum TaxID=7740 RepID=UPI00345443D8